MCNASVLLPIPDFLWPYVWDFDPSHPEYGIDAEGRKCLSIDECLVPAIRALWDIGVPTISCCCLHGEGYGVIALPNLSKPIGWDSRHHREQDPAAQPAATEGDDDG